MNKKVNTVLFVLGATAANMVLIFVFIIVLIMLAGVLFPDPSPGLAQVMILLVFFISLGLSFFVYHRVMKLISRKIDMDAYFHPIFKSSRKRK